MILVLYIYIQFFVLQLQFIRDKKTFPYNKIGLINENNKKQHNCCCITIISGNLSWDMKIYCQSFMKQTYNYCFIRPKCLKLLSGCFNYIHSHMKVINIGALWLVPLIKQIYKMFQSFQQYLTMPMQCWCLRKITYLNNYKCNAVWASSTFTPETMMKRKKNF